MLVNKFSAGASDCVSSAVSLPYQHAHLQRPPLCVIFGGGQSMQMFFGTPEGQLGVALYQNSIAKFMRHKIVDQAASRFEVRMVALMSSTIMTTIVTHTASVAKSTPRPVCQTSRHGMHTPFSSGSTSNRRVGQRKAQRHTACVPGRNATILAAAATDVASSTVQAIKKTVGGDIFVAGTTFTSSTKQTRQQQQREMRV